MTKIARGTLAMVAALALAGPAAALAGALNGKTYVGAAPSSGITEEGHHRVRIYAGGNLLLRVSGNGRSVTVRFSSSTPVLYCRTTEALRVQTTSAARVSRSGAFRATISERFRPGPGAAPIMQVVSGTFSGGKVHGTIKTNAAECSGVSYFSASAH